MAGGYSIIDLFNDKPAHDKQERELRLRTMQQGIEERDSVLSRQRKEDAPDGVTDKAIRYKGLKLDIDNQNAEVEKSIAGMKGDMLTNDVAKQIMESKNSINAGLYDLFKNGDEKGAVELYNKSHHTPGDEITGMKFEDTAQQGPDGKPIQQLSLVHKDKGKAPLVYPVPYLEQLSQRFGAAYEKVGNNYIRRNRDGTVTPLYEPDQYVSGGEEVPGGMASKRTGLPPSQVIALPAQGPQPAPAAPAPQTRAPGAASVPSIAPVSSILGPGNTPAETPAGGGVPAAEPPAAAAVAQRYGAVMPPVQPGGPSRILPYPLSSKEQAARDARRQHEDARVKQLDSEVRFYLTGSNTFANMDPKTQAQYDKLMAIGGAHVRAGKNPEEARRLAVDDLRRSEKLQPGGKPGSGAYTGPAPWRQ